MKRESSSGRSNRLPIPVRLWQRIHTRLVAFGFVITFASAAVFNPALQAQTYSESQIYSFGRGIDGNEPLFSGVVRDAAGNFYGTTIAGGTFGGGTVFKVDPTGNETILHNFFGGRDGQKPYAGLVRDEAGRLYGTTIEGGNQNSVCTSGCGVVFEIDVTGREKILLRFTGGADGAAPVGGVIRDSAGNLYGTTELGGASSAGTVFKLDASGVETVLHSFAGSVDGENPQSSLVRDAAGNLYGTTSGGGPGGFGTVFELDPSGHATVLHGFASGSDGSTPMAGLLRAPSGDLYGTTFLGGAVYGQGTVFKVDTNGNETILHAFQGSDGNYPESILVHDSQGNLYGTALQGGPAANLGGTIFKITPRGAFSVLYDFLGEPDGGGPAGPLTIDSAGNLYGTTASGGTTGNGTVFKLAP